jgi:ferrous iron transport protein B
LKKNKNFLVVDLPGLYNISHPIDEELIVNNELCCGKKSDKIVNVVGAQSIKRDLKLVIQSLETGKLSSIIINMIDAVNINNIKIDKLSKLLNNVEILPLQSNKKIDQHKIIERIIKCDAVNHKLINYGKEIEKIINDISKYIPNMTCSKR